MILHLLYFFLNNDLYIIDRGNQNIMLCYSTFTNIRKQKSLYFSDSAKTIAIFLNILYKIWLPRYSWREIGKEFIF